MEMKFLALIMLASVGVALAGDWKEQTTKLFDYFDTYEEAMRNPGKNFQHVYGILDRYMVNQMGSGLFHRKRAAHEFVFKQAESLLKTRQANNVQQDQNLIGALRQLLSLKQVLEFKCNQEEQDILKSNALANYFDADKWKNYPDTLNHIQRAIGEVGQKHAQACNGKHVDDFGSIVGSMDSEMRHRVEVFMDTLVKAESRPKDSGLVDIDETYDHISLDISRSIDIAGLQALQALTRGADVDLKSEATMQEYVIKPCEHYTDKLDQFFNSVEYDMKFELPDGGKLNKNDLGSKNFNAGLLRYRLCQFHKKLTANSMAIAASQIDI